MSHATCVQVLDLCCAQAAQAVAAAAASSGPEFPASKATSGQHALTGVAHLLLSRPSACNAPGRQIYLFAAAPVCTGNERAACPRICVQGMPALCSEALVFGAVFTGLTQVEQDYPHKELRQVHLAHVCCSAEYAAAFVATSATALPDCSKAAIPPAVSAAIAQAIGAAATSKSADVGAP